MSYLIGQRHFRLDYQLDVPASGLRERDFPRQFAGPRCPTCWRVEQVILQLFFAMWRCVLLNRRRFFAGLVFIHALISGSPVLSQSKPTPWLPHLGAKLEQFEQAAASLTVERQSLLRGAAELIASEIQQGRSVSLNFICTHNSRRSHLAQVWGAVAAQRYGVSQVHSYSGGTEATACNERVVRSLRRAGLSVVTESPTDKNPLYLLQFAEDVAPIKLFSKRYNDPSNPPSGFVAMMCCSDADEKCPVVSGAIGRIALHYRDPKESDGTKSESATYDQRRDEIAAEMFFLMREVSNKLNL